VQAGKPAVEAGDLIASCTAMLFVSLFLGWLGRRVGLRRFISVAFFWVAGATFAVVWFSDDPDLASWMLILSAVGAVSLDSVAVVTFLRAVRGWERPQMTMVFMRSSRVDILPFNEVDADFAAAEGEGDGSLAYWQNAHERFFKRSCQRIGIAWHPDLPVVCERFEVLYPRS
jgi:hypothetical protein